MIKRVKSVKITPCAAAFCEIDRVSWGFCRGGVGDLEGRKLKSAIKKVNCHYICLKVRFLREWEKEVYSFI